MTLSPEQAARPLVPAHPDLPHAAGVGAQVASEAYVESPDRIVLAIRSYLPSEPVLDGSYLFPDVVRLVN